MPGISAIGIAGQILITPFLLTGSEPQHWKKRVTTVLHYMTTLRVGVSLDSSTMELITEGSDVFIFI